MTITKSWAGISLLAIFILALMSANAEAYRYFAVWSQIPVRIAVDQTGLTSIHDSDHGVKAVINAINSGEGWNSSVANLVEAYAAPTQAVSGDGQVTVNFNDPDAICTGGCIAVTVPLVGNDGIMRDADIFTNLGMQFTSMAESDGCFYEIYIESVMVHEVGHVLGLLHVRKPYATMYPSIMPCDNRYATISRDEAKGVYSLYGN